jgi:DNA modification methylase
MLDPYCGTGTACKIAYEMNLRSIGIDINGKYIKQARASIEQKPLSLF